MRNIFIFKHSRIFNEEEGMGDTFIVVILHFVFLQKTCCPAFSVVSGAGSGMSELTNQSRLDANTNSDWLLATGCTAELQEVQNNWGFLFSGCLFEWFSFFSVKKKQTKKEKRQKYMSENVLISFPICLNSCNPFHQRYASIKTLRGTV